MKDVISTEFPVGVMVDKKQQQALFDNLKRLTNIYPSLEARIASAAQAKHPYVLRALELFGGASRNTAKRSVARCREAYGLTEAEAKLAIAIADGTTVAGYAEETGLSQWTVRTQLKTVFQKTGVKRQAELVLLLNGPDSSKP